MDSTQTCLQPGCDKKLRSDNSTGYCVGHRYLSPTIAQQRAREIPCPGCGEVRPTYARGLCSSCYFRLPDVKEKCARRCAAHYRANKPRYYNNHLLRSYGVSLSDAESLLTKQGGVCAICRQSVPRLSEATGKQAVCLDHCHRTGRVRGVLCHVCNKAIGMLGDSPARLRAAAEYIEQHEGPND